MNEPPHVFVWEHIKRLEHKMEEGFRREREARIARNIRADEEELIK
jgi:hypothetical protein